MNLKDFYLIVISVFLSILITLLVVKPQAKIVVVDNDEIFKKLIVDIQRETKADNEEVLMAKMAKYKNVRSLLDERMAIIAKEKNFIILPKNVVIGGEDLTNQAKLLLDDLIKEQSGRQSQKELVQDDDEQ
jgi:hypothetical protein